MPDRNEPAPSILVLNSGSSSLKAALFVPGRNQGGEKPLLEATAAGIGQAEGKLTITDGDGKPLADDRHNYRSQAEALEKIAASLVDHVDAAPQAIGHRVVHGGMQLTRHQQITPALLEQLEQAIHFAPLHIPASLELIRKSGELYPSTPQFACFDTAFHQTMPEQAWRLPVPREWGDRGVRRYGFHGLSYESIVAQFGGPALALPDRLVVAHLGSGSSLCAIKRGQSIDTSMGLTPAGGVPMATRTGDLDPGVLIFLMRAGGLSLDDAEALVNHSSGLRALSAGLSDMQKLEEEAAAPGGEPARLAIEIFANAVAKTIASYLVSLQGLDLLVFTGGIGEHSAGLRMAVCTQLYALGLRLDPAANAQHAGTISAAASVVPIRILPAQEDLQIARHVSALLASGQTRNAPPRG